LRQEGRGGFRPRRPSIEPCGRGHGRCNLVRDSPNRALVKSSWRGRCAPYQPNTPPAGPL